MAAVRRPNAGTPAARKQRVARRRASARSAAEGQPGRINRLYAALIRAGEAVLRIRERDRLFEEICRIATTYGGFRMAAVRLLDARTQTLAVAASRGDDKGYLKNMSVSFTPTEANAPRRPADILREGRYYVSDDFTTDPNTRRAHQWAVRAGIGSFATFPLRSEGEMIGALSFYAEPKGFFKADLVKLLSHLADNLSFALEKAAREQERAHAEQLRRLEHGVNRCLAEAGDAAAALRAVMRVVCEAEGWMVGRFFGLDEQAGVLRFSDGWAIPEMSEFVERSRGIVLAPGEGLAGRVWQSGQPLWVADVSKDKRVSAPALARGAVIRGAFVFPATAEGKVLGVFGFSSREMRRPDERLLESIGVIGSQIGQFLERKRRERELAESETRFRALTAMSSDWFWEQDENFRYTSMSYGLDNAARLSSASTLGKCRWELPIEGVSDEEWRRHRAALEAHEPFEMTYRMRNDKNDLRWFHIVGRPRFDAEGRFRGYRGTGRDITEGRCGEEELQRFRAAMDASADSIVLFDPVRDRYVDFNRTACEMLGYTREELMRLAPSEVYGRPHEELAREYADLIAGGRKYAILEGRRHRKDGTSVPVEVHRRVVASAQGDLIIAVGRDISERKRAEQVRALEHAVNRCLADADSAAAGLRAAIRVVCETEGWESGRYFGWDAEAQLLRLQQAWSVPGEAMERFIEQSKHAAYAPGVALAGRSWQSGQAIWVADITDDPRVAPTPLAIAAGMRGAFVFPVMTEGEALGVLAFNSREVREPDERLLQAVKVIGSQIGQFLRRQRAEQALRESEERLRVAQAGAGMVVLEWDIAKDHLTWTDSVEWLRGPLPADSGKYPFFKDQVHPDDRERFLAARALAIETLKGAPLEYRIVRTDGEVLWILSQHVVIPGADGKAARMLVSLQNITERKRAEQLRELEHRVNRCLADAEDAASALRETMRVICESERWEGGEFWRVDKEAGRLCFAWDWISDSVPAQTRQLVERSRDVAFAPGQGAFGRVWQSEQPIWIADSTTDARIVRRELTQDARMRGALMFPAMANGTVLGVLGFASTEVREPDGRMLAALQAIGNEIGQFLLRRDAEDALARFRAAIELSPDSVTLIDRASMRYVDFNRSACEAVGYSREELLRMGPQDLNDRPREELEREYDDLIAGGTKFAVAEHPRRRRDGSLMRVEIQRSAVKSGGRDLIVAIARDVTERKRAEQLRALEHAVNRSLAEAPTAAAALQAVLGILCESEGWEVGQYWRADEGAGLLRIQEVWMAQDARAAVRKFIEDSRPVTFAPGQGLCGGVWQAGEPLWIADAGADARVIRRELVEQTGIRGAFLFPVIADGATTGVLEFWSPQVREPDARLLAAVRVIGSQIGQFLRRKQAEEALRESEDRLQQVVRVSEIGIFDHDHRTDAIYRSPQQRRIYGWGPDEKVTLQGFFACLHPDDRERIKAEIRHGRDPAGEGTFDTEYRIVRRDGEVRWIATRSQTFFEGEDGARRPVRTVGAVVDITERKNAERVRALEHAVNRCLAESDDASAAIRAVIRVVCASENWECGRFFRPDEETGLMRFAEGWSTPGEAAQRFIANSDGIAYARGTGLVGRAWQSGEAIWSPDILSDSRVAQPRLSQEAGMRGAVIVPVVSEGNVIGVFTFNSRQIRQPDEQRLQAFRVIGSQIGQYLRRKQAEEALRRFRTAMDISADSIMLVDRASMHFVDVNRTACKTLGYSREELLRLGPHDLTGRPREDFEREYDALITGRVQPGTKETAQRRKDGSVYPVEVDRSVIASGKGHLIVAVVRDVSERKRAEQLRQLEHAVNRHIASAGDAEQALQAVMQTICESEGWECGEYWRVDEGGQALRLDQLWLAPDASARAREFFERSRSMRFAPGEGLVGYAWETGKSLWVPDADKDSRVVRRGLSEETGLRSTLVFPVMSGARALGVMTCTSSRVREPDQGLLQAIGVIGAQIGQYLQRKQAEEELRRFRVAMDKSADMIVLIDRTAMRFVDVNTTACRLLGYSREELLGLGPQDVLPESRQDLERAYDALLAAPSGDTSSVATGMKSRYRRKDGTTFPFESTRHVFRSGDGWLIAAISRDITERIAAQQALLESNERFDFAARATNDIIWDWDFASDAVWWNENFYALFGYGDGELAWSGSAWLETVHPEDRGRVDAGLRRASDSGAEFWSEEYRFRRRDGSYADVLDRGHLIRDTAGRTVRMIGAMVDVTARREDERRIRDQALRQQLMAEFGREALANPDLDDVMAQAVELVSVTLKADYANVLELEPERKRLNYRATAGWSREMLGDNFVAVDPGSRAEYVLSQREAVISDDIEADTRFSHAVLLKAGVKSSIAAPILSTRNVFGIFGVHSLALRRFSAEDVSFVQGVSNILAVAIERKSAEERLAYLAQFDSLTGLPNRHLFRDRLVQTMAQAQRGGWPMAVLFIDLDRFKLVNDSFGHPAGDKLLQEAGARLSACLRSGDTVGRLGGDEFGAILAGLHDPADTALVAQKIITALGQPFAIDGQEAFISASIGITLYPEDSGDAGALIMNADTAMYRAKEQGRSNYQFFTREMNERSLRRVQLDGALRHALERNEFRLHYQPKADLATGRICGMEALLRWQRPEVGLVSPADFIPVLEDTGMIVPVGEWVLRAACEQAKAWQEAGLAVPVVSVNLSARQFQQKNLDATVRGILEQTGVEPGTLELEITESLLMHDPESAERILRSLKESGVRLSVDDFGTGYSSLGYLKRFPLDTLKIDRTFVRDISADSDDAVLTLAIINLAHNLRLNVIAEGVETEAQLDFLALHACDQIQGYYFCKPMPAEDCERALRENLLLRRHHPAGANEPALLLLDDSEEDLLLLGHALRQGGFNVYTANSAEQAFKLLTGQAIDVVISDQRMPGMSGVEFLGRVRKLYPRVLRILATSASDPAVLSDAVNRAGIDKFLSKHWDATQLRREVHDAYRQKYVASAA